MRITNDYSCWMATGHLWALAETWGLMLKVLIQKLTWPDPTLDLIQSIDAP